MAGPTTRDETTRAPGSGTASLAGGLALFTIALLAIAALVFSMTGTTPTP